jgi:hypothetical protein
VRLERNTVGHFAIEGDAFDGWCDGWPLTDDELDHLLKGKLRAERIAELVRHAVTAAR